jgi:hypothetical protein
LLDHDNEKIIALRTRTSKTPPRYACSTGRRPPCDGFSLWAMQTSRFDFALVNDTGPAGATAWH